MLLFIIGCSNNIQDKHAIDNENDTNIDNNEIPNEEIFEVVASEKSLPDNFDKIAFIREVVPYYNYLVKRAANETQYEGMWNFFNLSKEIHKVDLEKKEVFFIGLYESGSCSHEIQDIKINSKKHEIVINLTEPQYACTSDATPRTIVIEVSKEKSKGVKSMTIVESGEKTTFPLDEY